MSDLTGVHLGHLEFFEALSEGELLLNGQSQEGVEGALLLFSILQQNKTLTMEAHTYTGYYSCC